MTHTAFFHIPVNFAFNLPHYATSYMHHTGKKESEKEILKKIKKKIRSKNLLQGGFEPAPLESVRTKTESFYHWTDFVNPDN